MATTGFSPASAMPAGRGHGVALGDADVDQPLGGPGLEGQQARRAGHRRGDGDDAGVLVGLGQQGLENASV